MDIFRSEIADHSDNQVKQLQKMDKPVEIDLSDAKLGEEQKQKLRNLINGFKGLFFRSAGVNSCFIPWYRYWGQGTGSVYRYDRVKKE
ncbi:hypothetical protein TNCV_528631 [Trichonephila clavipes]|nr:hypothetical protein TNCV_528631 [Trichonephila clavipes]